MVVVDWSDLYDPGVHSAAATRSVIGPARWRLWLSVAGAGLGILPLVQGDWSGAVVATFAGAAVVGAWALGTRSGRTVGVWVGVVLLASLVAVFAFSQWPRGLIRAPWPDWLAGWLAVGVVFAAAMVTDWIRHAEHGVVRIGATGRGTVGGVLGVGAAVVAGALVVVCCGYPWLNPDAGALRFAPGVSEIQPLPPSLRLVSAGPCVRGGTAGACVATFVVASTDGADRAVTARRLADQLRRLGWPVQPTRSSFYGCRRVGGILPWTAHCLVLDDGTETLTGPAGPPSAVTVSISNLD